MKTGRFESDRLERPKQLSKRRLLTIDLSRPPRIVVVDPGQVAWGIVLDLQFEPVASERCDARLRNQTVAGSRVVQEVYDIRVFELAVKEKLLLSENLIELSLVGTDRRVE